MTLEQINKMPSNTIDELKAQIAALTEYNKTLKAQTKGQLSIKTGDKGGVSVSGFGRFPVTLYPAQWQKLLADEMVLQITEYIEVHKDELSWEKPEKAPEEKYTAEQRAADTRVILTPANYTAEEVAFATGRLNAAVEKRFGSK